MRGQDRTYTHESAAAGRPGSAQGAAFWALVALVPRCTEVRALPLGGQQPVAAPYPTRVAWRDGRAPSGWVSLAAIVALWTFSSGCEDRTGPTPTGAPQQDVPAAHREQPFGRWWRWCRGVLKFGRCHWAESSPPRPPTPPVWRGVTAGHHPAGSRWPPSSHSGPFLQDARTGQDLHPRERRSRTSRQRTGSSLLGAGGAGAEVWRDPAGSRWPFGLLRGQDCRRQSSPPRPPTPPVWRGVTAGHHPAGSRWPPSSHSGPFLQDARTGQDLHPRERRSRTSRQRTGSSLLGGGGAGAEVY